ncbi:MFS transporter [Deinococcus sp. QL22]|uniref:MFS transporter n=1 Tax=Deinococcus sp. QL22 TaxID=2939437 RepID=UPI002017D50D|nr:MFS transporter [Deinococcus sp. QL22]UQN07978.1 MFS transporter [Deinococcus sp. QL22]
MSSPLPALSPPPLWTRDFTLWWLGNAQSALGSALAGIALAYLVLQETGSSGQMGVNLALTLLPSLFSPLVGAVVDRLPLRGPLIVLNLLRGAAQLLVGWAALTDQTTVGLLHGVAFFGGVVTACYAPASIGITPRLVPAVHRARATSVMQGSTQVMQLIGLVGGGALVSLIGSGPSLILDGLSFWLFSGLLLLIRLPARDPSPAPVSLRADFVAGLRYARSSPALIFLPLQALVINAALAPMEMLLPARMDVLGVGARGFGLFLGLLTGGMAVASLVLAWQGARVNFRPLGIAGFALTGLTFLALSFTWTPGQMYGVAVLCGATLAMLNVSLSLTFQTLVHPDYYGRVGSLLTTFGTVGIPITLLGLAPIADRVPLNAVFVVSGVLLLLTSLSWTAILRRTPSAIIVPPDSAGVKTLPCDTSAF